MNDIDSHGKGILDFQRASLCWTSAVWGLFGSFCDSLVHTFQYLSGALEMLLSVASLLRLREADGQVRRLACQHVLIR